MSKVINEIIAFIATFAIISFCIMIVIWPSIAVVDYYSEQSCNTGPNYTEKVILPAVRTAVREAASKFTSQQAYSSQREMLAFEVERSIREKIVSIVSSYYTDGEEQLVPVLVEQVMIRNVGLPVTLAEAIERKASAEQDSLAMVFTLEKERQEAQRKEIEAQGIQTFQTIVRQGIDEQLLRWKGIEATQALAQSPNSKVVIFGSNENGGLPLILNSK